MTLCRRQIAYQQCYPARALAERIAQRELVIDGSSIINIALGNTQCLIRETLQPENRCKGVTRNDLLIVPKAVDMESVSRRDVVAEHSLDMSPRIGLLSEQMQREADHAIADENIPGVGRPRSHLLEPLCKGQNFAQVSIGEANGPQPRDGAQLIVGIVKLFGNCQGGGPYRLDFGGRTCVIAQRPTQRRQQLQGLARAGARVRFEAVERALGAAATFLHQRQESPERYCGDRQSGAELRIAAWRKCPVQRRTDIVDLAAVGGQPLRGRSCLPFGLCALEQVPKIFGMTPREQLGLAGVLELAETA